MARLFPKNLQDRVLLSVFVLGGHLALWYETCMVRPYYESVGRSSSVSFWFNVVFSVFMYINGLTNLYKMRMTSLTGNEAELEEARRSSSNLDSWIFCAKCQDQFPPRSHHCPLCDECVLRRDHHCWFAGCCVGIANHRYYLVIISYVFAVAVYTNSYNFEYVGVVMGGHTVGSWLCICAPHVAVALGLFESFHQFFVAVITFVAYFFMLMVGALIREQLVCIYRGQTQYEKKKGVTKYNQGWRKNLRELLGDRWVLVFFWPWTKSAPGSGIEHVKVE